MTQRPPKVVQIPQRAQTSAAPQKVERSDAEKHREHVGFLRGMFCGAGLALVVLFFGGVIAERSVVLGTVIASGSAQNEDLRSRIPVVP